MSQITDHERFADLLQAHSTQLFGYLHAMVRNFSDAEDLYQETSMELWKKFGEYREGTNFFHWAKATARYKTLNHQRSKKRRQQFSLELQAMLTDVFDELSTDLLQIRLEALRECRELLGEADCQLMDVCYSSNLSFREVANELGRSPKSVYDALGRIRRVLMKCIEAKLAEKRKDA